MARLRAAATVSMEVATRLAGGRGEGGEPTGVVLVASVAAMGIAQGRDRVSDSGGCARLVRISDSTWFHQRPPMKRRLVCSYCSGL